MCFVHRCRYTFQTTVFKPIKVANLEINLNNSFLRVYCVRFFAFFFRHEKGLSKNRVQIKVSNSLEPDSEIIKVAARSPERVVLGFVSARCRPCSS